MYRPLKYTDWHIFTARQGEILFCYTKDQTERALQNFAGHKKSSVLRFSYYGMAMILEIINISSSDTNFCHQT